MNIYAKCDSIIIRYHRAVKRLQAVLTNHDASSILQTEGTLTAKVSFPSRMSKEIDRQAWNTEAVNLFCYHHLFGRAKSSTRYRMRLSPHQRSVKPLQPEESAAAWSQTTSSDIPPFAFEAPGRVLPKSFLPDLCLVYVGIEKLAIRDRKAWPPILQSAPYQQFNTSSAAVQLFFTAPALSSGRWGCRG